MSNPTVSVVVPNYNHARFLRRRLDSILAQTFGDYELIILDDASTDASIEIIGPYLRDPRVRFHSNASNSGSTFAQWNRGVALAGGEFVWLAESDDYADARILDTLVALLRSHPNVGIAYCESYEADENDSIRGIMSSHTADLDFERWRHPFLNNGLAECANYLFWKNTIPNASAVVFRRDVFLRSGGAPTHLRLAGDWLTWARMLCRSDLAFTPEPLNYFRFHGQSVRSQVTGRRYFDENWEVRRFISEHCRLDGSTLLKLAELVMAESYSRILGVPPDRQWAEFRAGLRQFGPWLVRHPLATARVALAHRPLRRIGLAAQRLLPAKLRNK